MRPALFLDRDGIINVDKHHVFRIEDIDFYDGIFDLVALANSVAMPVVIVTNQAGIARGKYTEDDFHALMNWMQAVFQSNNAKIDAVYFCPTHPDFPDVNFDKIYAGWRKPEPGMFHAAACDLDLDLSKSFLIGDRISDARAGLAAGITRILIVNPNINHLHAIAEVDLCINLKEAYNWLRHKLA